METNSDIDLLRNCVNQGLIYMLQLTQIQEDELFKICVDFWCWLTNDVMMQTRGSTFFGQQG